MKKITLSFLVAFLLFTGNAFATLTTPSMVSPSHGATSQNVNVYLDWGAVTGANWYEFKLGTIASLTGVSPVSTGSTSGYTCNQLNFNTTYYWQVRAKSASDSSAWSIIYQFTTHDYVGLASPSNGAINQAINVQLDWASVSGITYYDVEIDTVSTFNSPAYETHQQSSSYSYYYTSQLRFNTTYYWRARARHNNDTTSWSTMRSFTTHEYIGLSSPSDGATNQDVNVQLDWYSVAGITYYDVEIDTVSTFNSPAYETHQQSSSYSYYYMSQLRFNTTYYWRVRARHNNDTTSWTTMRSFTTTGYIGLYSPADGATNQDVNVQLDWSTVNGITYYDVEIDTVPTFNSTAYETHQQSSSYSYYYTTELLFNTTYYWRARARHNNDTTAWSTIRSFTTTEYIGLVSPADGATNQNVDVLLDWTTVDGITYYDVEIDTVSTFNSAAYETRPISSTYSSCYNLYLRFNTMYYWRVRARHNNDTTAWSTIRSFTTTDYIGLVSPADGATNQNVDVLLDWTTVDGITYYDVEIDTVSTFNSAAYETRPISSTYSSCYNLYLRFNTTYYWRVRARHPNDTSSWSAVRSFTTFDKITHTSPSNGATGISLNPTINWYSKNGITIYQYQYSEDINYIGATIYSNGTTSQDNLSNLSYGTSYYWRVRTAHPNDTSSWSDSWMFTTLYQLTSPVILISPADGSTNQALSIQLDWQTLSGATYYQYTYADNSSFFSAVTGNTFNLYETVSGLQTGTTYYWKIRANNGSGYSPWSSIWSFTTDISTDISNVDEGIYMYPNPATSNLSLDFPDAQEREIQLIDMQGKEIINKIVYEQNIQLSINDIPKGIYLIRILHKDGCITKKLIKD
jgi:Secretion system C-terminal sorting domain